MARPAFEIEVQGLGGALKSANTGRAWHIERGRYALKRAVASDMADVVRGKIRSRSGRLASSWQGLVRADGRPVIRSRGVVYAKASVRGALIVPKRARVLALSGGGFSRRVVLRPGAYLGDPTGRRSYVSVAFEEFGAVLERAFKRLFG